MPSELEPNVSDILASKFGVTDLNGHVWVLHILLSSLFFVLREKGTIDAQQIDAIFDAASGSLSERFQRLSGEHPKAAEHFKEMHDKEVEILDMIRRDVTAWPASQQGTPGED